MASLLRSEILMKVLTGDRHGQESPAAIVKHTRALFIATDLKKAHEDNTALMGQHSAQLVLK